MFAMLPGFAVIMVPLLLGLDAVGLSSFGEEAQRVKVSHRNLLIRMLMHQIVRHSTNGLLGSEVHGTLVAGVGNIDDI